jgi:hypothetical protein
VDREEAFGGGETAEEVIRCLQIVFAVLENNDKLCSASNLLGLSYHFCPM